MESEYRVIGLVGPYYFWTGCPSHDVCCIAGNYKWRKVWWRIYRCWYED